MNLINVWVCVGYQQKPLLGYWENYMLYGCYSVDGNIYGGQVIKKNEKSGKQGRRFIKINYNKKEW